MRLKPAPVSLKNCCRCGKAFSYKLYKRDGKFHNKGRRHCSLSCYRNGGLGSRGGQVELICPVCSKNFKISKSYYNRKKHKEIRCSRECYMKRELSKRQPNDGEKLLGKILKPFGFKYVGNGKLFVGRKCPDFVCGKNIVELFGHRHERREVASRQKYLSSFGYRCLVIWYSDLRYPQNVLSRIRSFVN